MVFHSAPKVYYSSFYAASNCLFNILSAVFHLIRLLPEGGVLSW